MNKEDRAIILGLIIGDGSIRKQHDKRYGTVSYSFHVKHSASQAEYCEHKAKLIHSILGGKKPKLTVFDNSSYVGVRFSKGHKKLRHFYKLMYKDGRKVIRRRVLDMLTPHSIALWYMDDGCLAKKKRNGKVHAYDLILNTYLTKEENQIIIDYFKETYGIYFTQVRSKGKYRIRCGTKEARKFISLIEPYVIESMKYKISIQLDPN